MTNVPSSSGEPAGPRPASRRLVLQLLATLFGAAACNMPGIRPVTPSPPSGDEWEQADPPPPSPAATVAAPPSQTEVPLTQPSTPTPASSAPPVIVDAHEDIAWNWLEFGRDPARSALEIRAEEAGTAVQQGFGGRTTGLPQWLEGRIAVIFATLFVMPERHSYGSWMTQTYADAGEAHRKASQQLDRYRELAGRETQVRIIETLEDLDEVLATWQVPTTSPSVGLVLLMEGADPIQEPDEVRQWYDRGLRIVGPAWVRTRYAGGTGEPGPLTEAGRALLAAMAGLGMILDLSHMAEEAYLEAVDIYQGAVIASHSNPRAFLPTDRGLSDEMIRRLAARDGVVGIMPYNRYLKPGWDVGQGRESVPVSTVVEAIDWVVQLTGSVGHTGIGSDFDGGFGVEAIPAGMDTIADLPMIAEALGSRGYSDEDIALIMGGNWLRILRNRLPHRSHDMPVGR